MEARFAGKIAVVTGSSKGIGAAIAKRFAKEGASVIVNYNSSKEGADRVVNEIVSNGGRLLLYMLIFEMRPILNSYLRRLARLMVLLMSLLTMQEFMSFPR